MKYFIVADSMRQYLEYYKKEGINPNEVFYCENPNEAVMDVLMNKMQGLEGKAVDIRANKPDPDREYADFTKSIAGRLCATDYEFACRTFCDLAKI